jgi:CRISPR-associated protein Cas2
MRGSGKYIAVYDVSDDEERERVAKVLEDYGIRVQKSSFECVLTRGSRLTLERRLTDLKLESGFVFLYRLQTGSARTAIGTVPPNPLDDSNYAFVIQPRPSICPVQSTTRDLSQRKS